MEIKDLLNPLASRSDELKIPKRLNPLPQSLQQKYESSDGFQNQTGNIFWSSLISTSLPVNMVHFRQGLFLPDSKKRPFEGSGNILRDSKKRKEEPESTEQDCTEEMGRITSAKKLPFDDVQQSGEAPLKLNPKLSSDDFMDLVEAAVQEHGKRVISKDVKQEEFLPEEMNVLKIVRNIEGFKGFRSPNTEKATHDSDEITAKIPQSAFHLNLNVLPEIPSVAGGDTCEQDEKESIIGSLDIKPIIESFKITNETSENDVDSTENETKNLNASAKTDDRNTVTLEGPSRIRRDAQKTTVRSKSRSPNSADNNADDISVVVKGADGKEHIAKAKLENKKYRCLRCPRFIKNRRNIGDHYRRMHLRELYGCPVCSKKFGSKSDLKRHADKIHKLTVEREDIRVASWKTKTNGDS